MSVDSAFKVANKRAQTFPAELQPQSESLPTTFFSA